MLWKNSECLYFVLNVSLSRFSQALSNFLFTSRFSPGKRRNLNSKKIYSEPKGFLARKTEGELWSHFEWWMRWWLCCPRNDFAFPSFRKNVLLLAVHFCLFALLPCFLCCAFFCKRETNRRTNEESENLHFDFLLLLLTLVLCCTR